MNLFIRLFFLILSRFTVNKRSIGLHDVCETPFRVWITDHDAFGHMTYSRYLSHFGLSILDYHLQTGVWKVVKDKGWFPVVIQEEVKFQKIMKFPQKFVIQTDVPGWTENFIAVRHKVLSRGKEAATGLTLGRFIDNKGRTIPVARVLQEHGHEAPSPELSIDLLGKLQKLEQEAAERQAAKEKQDKTEAA